MPSVSRIRDRECAALVAIISRVLLRLLSRYSHPCLRYEIYTAQRDFVPALLPLVAYLCHALSAFTVHLPPARVPNSELRNLKIAHIFFIIAYIFPTTYVYTQVPVRSHVRLTCVSRRYASGPSHMRNRRTCVPHPPTAFNVYTRARPRPHTAALSVSGRIHAAPAPLQLPPRRISAQG